MHYKLGGLALSQSLTSLTLFIPLIVSSAKPLASLFQSPACQTEVQAAMQWWEYRRSIQAQRQANHIRDSLLQELFSLRRGLELVALNPANAHRYEKWLDKIEGLQRSLENLSHQLSPPYLDASLTLAIQYEVEQWKTKYSQIDFKLDLPQSWQQNVWQHNQIVIGILDEWLRINLSLGYLSEPIAIALKGQDDRKTLILNASYSDDEALEVMLASDELKHLNRVFELLMPGQIELWQQGQKAVWYFCWKGDN